MPSFTVTFDERETLPDRLAAEAESLGITVEQLIKRYIVQCLPINRGETIPASTLDDLFVKNGVLKPKKV
jgi:hypothetical protein